MSYLAGSIVTSPSMEFGR